jgi:hypothetical protein
MGELSLEPRSSSANARLVLLLAVADVGNQGGGEEVAGNRVCVWTLIHGTSLPLFFAILHSVIHLLSFSLMAKFSF